MAGQITKRNNNTWLVRIFLGRDAKNKRKYFNKTIHGTKKDAQKYLTAKLREKDLGVFVEPASMPLNEFLDKWLDEIAVLKLREQTLIGYKWLLNRYIRPKLGSKRLSDIQSYEVQKIYNDMKKAKYSPKTIRHAHNFLSSAMKQAVKWKMLMQNPCELCELPRKVKTEMKYFSPTEAKCFLETARENKHFALFQLALQTGARPGEYLGLQWKDIDFEQKVLSIKRTVIEVKGGGFRFDEPKTAGSRRSIPISQGLIDMIKRHRRKQLEAKMKLGSEYQNYELVFASEIGTPLQKKNIRDRHFKQLLKKANLPDIRLYDLRHTMATLLLCEGVNPKIVSERLGHASIVLTLDTYSHVLPTMQEDATDKLEMLLKIG
jgi:integrase